MKKRTAFGRLPQSPLVIPKMHGHIRKAEHFVKSKSSQWKLSVYKTDKKRVGTKIILMMKAMIHSKRIMKVHFLG